jgi:hypothetical protein
VIDAAPGPAGWRRRASGHQHVGAAVGVEAAGAVLAKPLGACRGTDIGRAESGGTVDHDQRTCRSTFKNVLEKINLMV